MSSGLYAIYVAAHEIHELGFVSALRDLYHRRGCRSFRSVKVVSSRLYTIYVVADEIFKTGFVSALRDFYIAADDIHDLICKMDRSLRDLHRRCKHFMVRCVRWWRDMAPDDLHRRHVFIMLHERIFKNRSVFVC
jgi:hypothetical protein